MGLRQLLAKVFCCLWPKTSEGHSNCGSPEAAGCKNTLDNIRPQRAQSALGKQQQAYVFQCPS
eukprot:4002827-Amphidinium_carterae.2